MVASAAFNGVLDLDGPPGVDPDALVGVHVGVKARKRVRIDGGQSGRRSLEHGDRLGAVVTLGLRDVNATNIASGI